MGLLTDRIIRDFKAPQDVSTLAVLFPLTEEFGDRLESLYFVVVNVGASAVNVILESSEDGTIVSSEVQTKAAPPGKQVEFAISGPAMLATKWRLSAQTDDPFPTTQVKWRIKAQQRTV